MNKKFIETYLVDDYEILTDNGYVDISASHKTIKYKIWEIKTDNHILRGADNHILFDKDMNEVFIKDFSIGEKILTENGLETIIYINETNEYDNMFDLELPEYSNRRYYTNGILSHNTMSMVSLGASYVRNGYDVLYVTLEMSEEKIGQLFDANFVEMEINDLPSLEFSEFKDSILKTKKDSYGELYIKEFPTAGASTMSIRNCLNELKLKSGFKPKILIVDYINLMRSDRYSTGDSYTIIKAICEELRGLMCEEELAGLSATQFNRGGAGSSDPSMTDTAESYGLPATCDLIMAMYGNEELSSKNIILWKALKNRFGGIINHRLVLNTKFEYAMLCNHKKDDDPVPYISNSEKTIALMAKMSNRKLAKKIDDESKSDINELFDTFLD